VERGERAGEFQLSELLIGKLTMGLLIALGLSLLWLVFGKNLPLISRLSKTGAGRRNSAHAEHSD
jgi:hypothetical protein